MLLSESLIQQFIDLCPNNATILDVCCGTDSLGVMKKLIKANFQVTGIDISEATLNLFKRKLEEEIPESEVIKKINFSVQDVRAMGIQPKKIDGLTAIYALDYLRTTECYSVFQSFFKILKPAGPLLLSFTADSEAISRGIRKELYIQIILEDLSRAGFELLSVESKNNSPYCWILTPKKSED
jgi:ubiquinone/menaquinone biosynthesis C-methylase UbiE